MTTEHRRPDEPERYIPPVPPERLPEEKKPPTDLSRRVESMCRQLEATIAGEVRFDGAHRAMYAHDSSNYRFIPVGVVYPKSAEDIIEAVDTARTFGVPITHRGGGTSLAGQTTNATLIIDSSKYFNGILEIDAQACFARVEPGLVLDRLRDETTKQGVTFGPDPSTHAWCTLGGMIGNNACGVHAQVACRTSDNVEELDIVTYDGVRMRVGPTSDDELEAIIAQGGRKGQIYEDLCDLRDECAELIRQRFPDIPRRVSGYNLNELLPENGFNVARALVGTEGTCVNILEAKLRLIDSRPCRSLVVLGFDDIFTAADNIPRINKFEPIAVEGLDQRLIDLMVEQHMNEDDIPLLPDGCGWLMVEFGADSIEEADRQAQQMMEALEDAPDTPSMRLFDDPEDQDKIWEVRESGLGATARVPGHPDTYPGWEDSAVAPEDLGDYMRDLDALYDRYGYEGAMYGHFGHGLVHTRISFDIGTQAGVDKWRRFMEEAAELCCKKYNGTLSGEHGDGQARGEFLDIMFGDELIEAFERFRRIWDPDQMMNPHKGADQPYPFDQDLKQGPDYAPWEPETDFDYPEDHGKFSEAVSRCVGVGKCRRTDAGTMCPSYQVTHEEMHSTRGRSRLLFEMLQGDATPKTWDNPDVKEALDLCLACKGCKNECPVNVDMATYKAEFLSHYYEHNPRPRQAYAFGFIDQWARMASKMPGLVNMVTHLPGFDTLAKKAAGMPLERDIPRFAPRPFKKWFIERDIPDQSGRPQVVLWADTFNNFFHTGNLKAATHVLEAMGYDVVVPMKHLCCGRPLYDFGFLDVAKQRLLTLVEQLGPVIDADLPVVGLEPSCVSILRDEMSGMLSNNERARDLSQRFRTFGEFMMEEAGEVDLPSLDGQQALLHGHCHQKSVLRMDCDEALLDRLGVDYEMPDTGCCGMAGSFGFEDEKYDVSVAIGERVLLPAVREAGDDTLVIADGFSCNTQVHQLAGRRPAHLAQVVYLALEQAHKTRPNSLIDS
ncbi:MAG: FAD-binding and (Fe-S)-binding domain-containing protein [Persicimonas sp.]